MRSLLNIGLLLLSLASASFGNSSKSAPPYEIVLDTEKVVFNEDDGISIQIVIRDLGTQKMIAPHLYWGLSVVWDAKEHKRDPNQRTAWNGPWEIIPKTAWRTAFSLSEYLVPAKALTAGRHTIALKDAFAESNTLTVFIEPKIKLAPLPLRLPAPSLGANGPIEIPTGPHMEPLLDRPRAPFLAPVGVTNLALGKKVTASTESALRGTLSMVTDGNKQAFDSDLVQIFNGVQWVQIDLEQQYPIYAIVVWHDFYLHFPVFRSVVVQAADAAGFTTNVRTIFNNDYENLAGLGAGTDKQYVETYQGKLIDAKGINARYLRFYSNGSNNSPLNGYVEIEIWGLPAR